MDADHLHDLEALNDQETVDYIVWEGEPLAETTKTLEERGVKSIVVKPCYGEPESGDFLSVMSENLEAARTILE